MNVDQIKDHALALAGLYDMLRHDLEAYVHDIDAHNLCSAVVEKWGGGSETFYSYSNPSGLPVHIRAAYNFIIGDVPVKFINRGGMQDLHTEVRLINYLFSNHYLDGKYTVTFFSSRTVCATCRAAIMQTVRHFGRTAAFNAAEFKVEIHGTIGEHIYPIREQAGMAQAQIDYQ